MFVTVTLVTFVLCSSMKYAPRRRARRAACFVVCVKYCYVFSKLKGLRARTLLAILTVPYSVYVLSLQIAAILKQYTS